MDGGTDPKTGTRTGLENLAIENDMVMDEDGDIAMEPVELEESEEEI